MFRNDPEPELGLFVYCEREMLARRCKMMNGNHANFAAAVAAGGYGRKGRSAQHRRRRFRLMASNIGMAVEGASPLGLGYGQSIASQVAGETEEQRRKRLQALQAAKQLPTGGMSSLAAGYGAAFGMGTT